MDAVRRARELARRLPRRVAHAGRRDRERRLAPPARARERGRSREPRGAGTRRRWNHEDEGRREDEHEENERVAHHKPPFRVTAPSKWPEWRVSKRLRGRVPAQ